jgi:hypothetical protein
MAKKNHIKAALDHLGTMKKHLHMATKKAPLRDTQKAEPRSEKLGNAKTGKMLAGKRADSYG